MNYSRVDEALLDKNIKEIELYKTEEEKTLNKICEKLISATQSYQSENTAQILNNIETAKIKIAPLKAKREKYITILNQVIIKYRGLSSSVENMFKGGEN